MFDFPGHTHEIYAVDWNPDGDKVISGRKDKQVKIWKNLNCLLYFNFKKIYNK
jgi:WD40 repeat protein